MFSSYDDDIDQKNARKDSQECLCLLQELSWNIGPEQDSGCFSGFLSLISSHLSPSKDESQIDAYKHICFIKLLI